MFSFVKSVIKDIYSVSPGVSFSAKPYSWTKNHLSGAQLYSPQETSNLKHPWALLTKFSKVCRILQRGFFFVNCEATPLDSEQVIDGGWVVVKHQILISRWMIWGWYAAGPNTLYSREGRRAVRYRHRNNPGCLTQTFPGDLVVGGGCDDCLCSCTGAERQSPYIFLLPWDIISFFITQSPSAPSARLPRIKGLPCPHWRPPPTYYLPINRPPCSRRYLPADIICVSATEQSKDGWVDSHCLYSCQQLFAKIKAIFLKISTKHIWDLQAFSVERCEVLEPQIS